LQKPVSKDEGVVKTQISQTAEGGND